ncbi:MAG: glutathione S-transferase [Ferrovibrio sp.]|uniref:glutathione S-transferase family protein n=1 Tax=Ferrovibrio sp. TaxID=1917215 RepID=UPI00262CAC0B|nr:glutathione S-transferase [Ferrovibrio sp.]MCW0234680.1 glutathione S-transferase [Ferrovibrio sp.]
MTLRLHRFALSGHAHRAELFLALLGLKAELVDVDLRGGEHKQPAFLAMNSFGQVPVLEDGDTVISDSNAILVYLASRYDKDRRWLPVDPAQAAQVQRWLSVAAGQLASGPAAARMVTLFKAPLDHDRAKAIAAQLFAVLEQHLAQQAFLVGNAPTIADVALYSYTAHAPEGGVSLQPWPHIRAWLARIEALPGFVPMPKTAMAA